MDERSNIAVPRGLVYVSDSDPGIRRRRAGKGFAYRLPDGSPLRDADVLDRIATIAVPPAWRDVWICPRPDGHIQATGIDDRGRKQYRYHPDWSARRSAAKYEQLAGFGEALPRIRRRLRNDLQAEPGELTHTLAAMMTLIDTAAIRVGSPQYSRENGTYGATTLLKRHLKLDGERMRLDYTAKGGKRVRIALGRRRLNEILEKIADLPGRRLFQWRADDGELRPVDSGTLNQYLAEISGEAFSVKTFRTWNGSVSALEAALGALKDGEPPTIKAMCTAAAATLNNTQAICRSSYIHPDVIALSDVDAGGAEALLGRLQRADGPRELRKTERGLLSLLQGRATP